MRIDLHKVAQAPSKPLNPGLLGGVFLVTRGNHFSLVFDSVQVLLECAVAGSYGMFSLADRALFSHSAVGKLSGNSVTEEGGAVLNR